MSVEFSMFLSMGYLINQIDQKGEVFIQYLTKCFAVEK